MPIQKITIEEFLKLAKQYPVLDVRSPGEYTHAHIPQAHSLPLFTDEERKQVGTAYKQQSREAAIKIGLDYFGGKMRSMVEQAESIAVEFSKRGVDSKAQVPPPAGGGGGGFPLLIHCWRGGMRSAAVAWLLDLYGYKVYLLVGGYKAYRKWVLAQFEKDYNLNIIGGYTGSGKTLLIHQLIKENKTVIDLEGLANHKGSAFGAIENIPQPGQEMFENLLAEKLQALSGSSSPFRGLGGCIYIEDESQRIGNLQIPMPLWYTMRKSPIFFIDVPFEDRLAYITAEYGKQKKKILKDAILRIQKRLGGLETKKALQFLMNDSISESFGILLTYYDKCYLKSLEKRSASITGYKNIICQEANTKLNAGILLQVVNDE